MNNKTIMMPEDETRIYSGCFAVLPKGTSYSAYRMQPGYPSLGIPPMPSKSQFVTESDMVVWVDMVGTSRGAPYVSWDGAKAWTTDREKLRSVDFKAAAAGAPYDLYPCLTRDGQESLEQGFAKEIQQARHDIQIDETLAPVLRKIMDRRIAGEAVSVDEEVSLVNQALKKNA